MKNINLNGCEVITKLPSLLCAPNLKNLNVSGCINLIEVDESFGHLDKLETWHLEGCSKLEILPSAPNLKALYMSNCKNLIKVDESFGHLDKLEMWYLRGCSKLEILPSGLMLRSLKYFDLSYCKRLEKFPAICAPNLKSLDISFCKNLIEVHESVGELHKLTEWYLESCIKLEILPSHLQLRSLQTLYLNDCRRLEKFPDIHPEMKNTLFIRMGNSGIRESSSSLTHLAKGLCSLELSNIPQLDVSEYGFLSLGSLCLNTCDGDTNELDFQYFPRLIRLTISYSNIISITQKISGSPTLRFINIYNCEQLREIPTLPHSIRHVHVEKCPSLDPQSSSRLLIRVRSLSLSLYV